MMRYPLQRMLQKNPIQVHRHSFLRESGTAALDTGFQSFLWASCLFESGAAITCRKRKRVDVVSPALLMYEHNPNRCCYCNKMIMVRDGERLADTKRKKFCNHSCAAKHNNQGVNRWDNKYNCDDIQQYYDQGNGIRACGRRFGISSKTFAKAVREGKLVARPKGMSFDVLLVDSRTQTDNRSLKKRLIHNGILVNCCSICGIDAWCGKPLTLQIDHINGINKDNRLENIRLLCPNCHTQTDTYSGKAVAVRRERGLGLAKR